MIATAATLTVVLANVGNVNVPGCQDQVFKLCQRPVEERAAGELRKLAPDLTGLIEILPPSVCERAPSSNPDNLCSAPLEPPSQVRRLLGDGLTEACDARYGWDCLAAHSSLRFGGRLVTRPVVEGCEDDGFTLNTATVRVRGWPVAVAVAHPDSMDAECRAAQLEDLLDRGLPPAGPALVLGDLNVDFYREDDVSAEVMKRRIEHFKPLSSDELTSFPGAPSQLDPSGRSMDGDTFLPAGPLGPRAIDHVLGREIGGTCEVRRVDGGGGMDHRAQVCKVRVPVPRLSLKRRRGCTLTAAFAGRSDVKAVRFTLGGRTTTDRRAPYRVRQRRGRRLVTQALTVTGDGPLIPRRLKRCRGQR